MNKRAIIWIAFAVVFGGLCYFGSSLASKQEREMEDHSKKVVEDLNRMKNLSQEDLDRLYKK
ncbi:MAG: hypothetical protein QM703_22725 [Gemmatales bacterium]